MATVLVVDDEPMVRRMLARFLEDTGFTVFTAGCASEAVKLSRSQPHRIDLLISDIVMPGMDGPSLATELKAVNPELNVLLMSGNCDSGQIDNAFEFLPKPFSMFDLLARVRRLISRSGRNRSH